jgi:hypothetical protein
VLQRLARYRQGRRRAARPEASVYVYENNSTDGTIATAKVAGAIVRRETYQAGRSW